MKSLFTILALLGLASQIFAQDQPVDSISQPVEYLDEVFVSAVRVTQESPVTFSNLKKEEIASRNLGQDIPLLLNFLPGVVTTSDAGAGIGYTGIRVRGSDATRVNVTINGIPYNDAESQGTFWVNMPDFSSSTQSIQLQRGVGTSTNGAAAFGASLNLATDAISEDPYFQVNSGIGSFATLKNNVKFSTGLLNNQFEFSGRLSKIDSEGYIDRAFSDLKSYFLQGALKTENSLLKALVFGGHEITYQAWYGTPLARLNNDLPGIEAFINENYLTDEEAENLRNSDRRYNYYTYENEVDNYQQDHAQLLWNQKWNSRWSSNLALHYTYGRGYFEQYKNHDDLSTYGISEFTLNGETVSSTDVIRRRWLKNDFYGSVFSTEYTADKLKLIFGGGYNKYEGDHFGEIIWARNAGETELGDRYYDDNSFKSDFNSYSKVQYQWHPKWSFFADVQYRRVNYEANGEDTGLVNDEFDFFNPKFGWVHDINQHNNLYFSFAHAHREPNRNDYEGGNPVPEKLNDFELGWRYISSNAQLNVNLYYMRYKDQLVLTGELNDVGAPLRANVGDSYRLGLELDANIKLGQRWNWMPNLAISENRNVDFVFQRDGVLQELGNTRISFSPGLIVGNIVAYNPKENMMFSLLTKYVGKQYMGNIDSEGSVLQGYSQTDFNVSYEIPINGFVKNIVLSGLINNIFNADIVSNGYFYTYDDTWSQPGQTTTIEGAGYYPQASTNFLLGATLNF